MDASGNHNRLNEEEVKDFLAFFEFLGNPKKIRYIRKNEANN